MGSQSARHARQRLGASAETAEKPETGRDGREVAWHSDPGPPAYSADDLGGRLLPLYGDGQERYFYYAHRRKDGTVLHVGQSNSHELFGVGADEISGRNIAEFLDSESRDRVIAADATFLDGEDDFATSIYRLKFNNSDHEITMLVSRFRLFDGHTGEDTVFLVGTRVDADN